MEMLERENKKRKGEKQAEEKVRGQTLSSFKIELIGVLAHRPNPQLVRNQGVDCGAVVNEQHLHIFA